MHNACGPTDCVEISGNWLTLLSSQSTIDTFYNDFTTKMSVKDSEGNNISLTSRLNTGDLLGNKNVVTYVNGLTVTLTNTYDILVEYLGPIKFTGSDIDWNGRGGFLVKSMGSNGSVRFENNLKALRYVVITATNDVYVKSIGVRGSPIRPISLLSILGNKVFINGSLTSYGESLSATGNADGIISIFAKKYIDFGGYEVSGTAGVIKTVVLKNTGTISSGIYISNTCDISTTITTISSSHYPPRYIPSGSDQNILISSDFKQPDIVIVAPCDVIIKSDLTFTTANTIIVSGRNIIFENGSQIDGSASNGVNVENDGGIISLIASRSVINATVNVNATFVGGVGGTVNIISGNDTTNLNATSNAGKTGQGGNIYVSSFFGINSSSVSTKCYTSVVTASDYMSGNVTAGDGGTIALDAGDMIDITADASTYVYVTRGYPTSSGGGSIIVNGGDDVTINANAGSMSSSSSSDLLAVAGIGGTIVVNSINKILASAAIAYSIASNSSNPTALTSSNFGGYIFLKAYNNIFLSSASVQSTSSVTDTGGYINICSADDVTIASDITFTGSPTGVLTVTYGKELHNPSSVINTPFTSNFSITNDCTTLTLTVTLPDLCTNYEYYVNGAWTDFTLCTVALPTLTDPNIIVRPKALPCLAKYTCCCAKGGHLCSDGKCYGDTDTTKCGASCTSCPSDAVCQHDECVCKAGFYRFNSDCLACTICGPGKFTVTECNISSNTVCSDIICAENYYVLDFKCVPCDPGSINYPGGDNATLGDTFCTSVICDPGYHVVNHECVECDPGTERFVTDLAVGDDTFCDVIVCPVNNYVVDNTCQPCPDGSIYPHETYATGPDTICFNQYCWFNQYVDVNNECSDCPPGTVRPYRDDKTIPGSVADCITVICEEDHHVQNHICVPCIEGTRPKGDDARYSDTFCYPTSDCPSDHYVFNKTCYPCPKGSTRPAGDPVNGENTYCEHKYCDQNQRVSDHECVSCPPGTTSPAGYDATGPCTQCDITYCDFNQHVVSNQCVDCPGTRLIMTRDSAAGSDTSC